VTQAATTSLMARGTTWTQRHIRTSAKMHSRVKGEDKLLFFQQLTTLLTAGTPLLDALRIVAAQAQSQKMQAVVRTIADRVAGGLSLNQAAADFPKVFDRQWTEVIKTGEISGQLGEVLTSLTGYITAARQMRAKLISAMIYPCILVVVAALAVVVMLWKVVPTFADFFKEFGSELPDITQAVIDLSDFLQTNGLFLLGGAVAAVVALRYYLRTEGGKRLFAQVGLTTPMVGECMVQAAMERFATNLVLLLRSGLPLLEAIVSLKGVFQNNTVYRDGLRRVEQRVAGGGGLAAALEESGLFTPLMVSMVRVGEESGQLADVLEEVAAYYRNRVQALVSRLTGIVEPLVILLMGVTVAVILMSIYLPMFQIASGPR
jgi:type IV pilus assembly protein PilC